MNSALFYSHEWKLYTAINLTHYNEEYKQFTESMSNVFSICEYIKFHLPLRAEGCFESLSRLEPIINNINLFQSSTDKSHDRVKRWTPIAAAIAAVAAATVTFSVAFSAGYFVSNNQDEHIERLAALVESNKERDIILSEQATYINSLTDVVTNGTDNLSSYLNSLSDKSKLFQNKIGKFTNSFSKHIYNLEMKVLVNEIVSVAMIIIISFQEQRQTLNSLLSLGHNAQNSPYVLSPSVFYTELANIEKVIRNKGLTLPFELTISQLPRFYQVSVVKATLVKSQLMLSFSIPLIKLSKFKLYKITPIPIKINGTVEAYVIPSNDFIAVDHKLKLYFS